MICILLAAGHNSSNLDNQIKDDQTGNLKHLEGVPKVERYTVFWYYFLIR